MANITTTANNNLPSKPNLPRLTDQQRQFCDLYSVSFNASQAAKEAGYSAHTINQKGATELLRKPQVQAYLQELIQNRADKLSLTVQDIVNELIKIAFVDVSDIFNDDGTAKRLSDIPKDARAAIASYEIKFNEPVIKLYSKQDALDKLGRFLGMYEKDNSQVATKLTAININWT